MDYEENLHKCREYITALEEEKRKIEMFQRELPLCVELVSQAIENYKQQLVSITTAAPINSASPATAVAVTTVTTTTDQCLNGQSECSEQTTSDCPPPVLEEFIPIKRPTSNSTDEQEEEEGLYDHHDENENNSNLCHNLKNDNNKLKMSSSSYSSTSSSVKKVDWLRSVQLWNQTVPDPPPPSSGMEEKRTLHYQNPRKVQVVEVKSNGTGGAFQPFQKDQKSSPSVVHQVKPPVSITTAATTIEVSTPTPTPTATTTIHHVHTNANSAGRAAAAAGNGGGSSHKKEAGSTSKDGGSSSRKARRCWSPELHKKFLNALQQLGGSHVATPKQIRELMKVDGLTNDEVKSHLQKYRLHTRRISPVMHHHNNTNTQQTPQFVVVGGIWVPSPPDYATAGETSSFQPHTGAYTTAMSADGSAPISVSASPHHLDQIHSTTSTTVRHSTKSDEERGNPSRQSSHSNGRCNSPATSSSTHTTTTSPAVTQAH